MKKMIIILMIMAACLASTALAVPSELTNGGFEDDTVTPGEADGWTLSAQDTSGLIYHQDEPANANSGDDFFEISCGDDGSGNNWAVIHTNSELDFVVTEDTEYTVAAAMKLADGATVSSPTLKIEWYSLSGGVYDSDDYVGEDESGDTDFVLTTSYVTHSFTATAPTGAIAARVTVIAEYNTPESIYYVDDVAFCEGDAICSDTSATLVSPSHGSFVDPVPAASDVLEWAAPSEIDGTMTYDVWFKVGGEPNMLVGAVEIASGISATSIDITTATVAQASLAADNDYHWQIIAHDSVIGQTDGAIWSFTTTNTPPFAEAGFDQNLWADGSLVVDLDMLYNDDADNYPGPLTRTITTTGGTFDVDVNVEDPNTITFGGVGTYTITLDVNDGLVSTVNAFVVTVYAADTADSFLEAHYTFDTDASDSSGNGHDGTMQGDAIIVAGAQVGAGALSLDGDGDFVTIADSAPDPNEDIYWADFGSAGVSEEVTIAVWVKPTLASWTSGDYIQIVSKGYPDGYRITRGDYNGVVFATDLVWDNGVVYGYDTYQMDDGQWHHLVATWDGGASALYIDGNFMYRMPQPTGTLLGKNQEQIQIGANQTSTSSQHFEGLIDNVRIYSVGLSADEVLKLYASEGGSGTCALDYTKFDLVADCVINLADFAKFASEWLICNDIIAGCGY